MFDPKLATMIIYVSNAAYRGGRTLPQSVRERFVGCIVKIIILIIKDLPEEEQETFIFFLMN